MRISAICQAYLPEQGGLFLADLAARWQAAGHDVTIWTAAPHAPDQPGRIVRPFPFAYSRRSILSRAGTQLGFVAGAAGALLWDAVTRHPPDVLVFAGAPGWASSLANWAPRRGSWRTVHWIMDLYPEVLRAQWPNGAATRLLSPPIRAALDAAWRRADAVVAITDRMAARIRARVPGADVRVIPLWAADSVRPCDDRGAAMRRSREIADDAFVVLYHGALGIAYDLAPILASAEQLLGSPGIAFRFVGQGAQRRWLDDQIRTRRLDNVRVHDPVTDADLPASLATGDVHLVSVRPGWDGVAFPSKIIGALAAGRPVLLIGPNDCEIAEMLRADDCGVTVANGRELAEQVLRLRDDPESRARLGIAARAAYERRFSRDRALAAWDDVIASPRAES